MPDKTLAQLHAIEGIRRVLNNYCRALDRMDKTLARSVWHADGTALYHDIFEGSGHGFVDWVWKAHAAMERHSHQIANAIIEVDGNTAVSETYVTVVLWTKPDADGGQQEIIGRGRYLDRWSLREGHWAITHREHILDIQTLHPLTPGYVSAASMRDETDPSFRLFGQI
jgi:hypothetical protein